MLSSTDVLDYYYPGCVWPPEGRSAFPRIAFSEIIVTLVWNIPSRLHVCDILLVASDVACHFYPLRTLLPVLSTLWHPSVSSYFDGYFIFHSLPPSLNTSQSIHFKPVSLLYGAKVHGFFQHSLYTVNKSSMYTVGLCVVDVCLCVVCMLGECLLLVCCECACMLQSWVLF